MSEALDIFIARGKTEEAFRRFPYDDATGLTVKAPKGNITQGYGCNLSSGWSEELAALVMRYQAEECENQLLAFPWFLACDPVRRSVLIDMAFNGGVVGLLNFHKMITAIESGDFVRAAHECHVANPALSTRYSKLAQLLERGASSSPTPEVPS